MDTIKRFLGWQLLRSVTQADTPLDAATMDTKPSYAMDITMEGLTNIELILAATGSDNGTVVVKLWGGRNRNSGPAQLIAAITFTLGTMQVNKDPQTQEATTLTRYADTASVTSYWPTDIKAVNNGNNLLCGVSFDCLDLAWIAAEVISLTNATQANVYLGTFS
jgi:hypothetical protein